MVSDWPATLRRLLIGFAGLALLSVWVTVIVVVLDRRTTGHAEAHAELLGAQHTLRAHARGTLSIARTVMAAVDAWIEAASAGPEAVGFAEIAAVVARLRHLDPARSVITLYDGDGRPLDDAGRATPASAGDRDLLEALDAAPEGTLHLGRPRAGPGPASLPMAMKTTTNGFGVGYLTVDIPIEHFERTYETLLISAPAVYGMIRIDGTVLVDVSDSRHWLGRRLPDLDLEAMRRDSGEVAVIRHQAFAGTGERMSGYAFLDPFPAVIFASFWVADIDARWQAMAIGAGAVAAGVSVVVVLLTLAALQFLARYTAESARVQRALAEAEAASAAKSDFMARVSHEFRTPLNAILGFSEVVRDGYLGPLPATYRDYGADIHRSGRELLALVDDVLDIAHLEARTAEPQDEAFDLSEIAATAAEAIRPAAEQRRIVIAVEESGPLLLRADRRMALRAASLAVSSAVRLSPEGATVTVSVRNPEHGPALVIADRGPGISEETLAHFFEPFGGPLAYVAAEFQTLGVAPALVRMLMETQGGAITLTERPGGGTIVTLHFPAARRITPAA